MRPTLRTARPDHRASALLPGCAVGLCRARAPRASNSCPAPRSSCHLTPFVAALVVLPGRLHARAGDLALGLGAQAAPKTSTYAGAPPPGAPAAAGGARAPRAAPSAAPLSAARRLVAGPRAAVCGPSPPRRWSPSTPRCPRRRSSSSSRLATCAAAARTLTRRFPHARRHASRMHHTTHCVTCRAHCARRELADGVPARPVPAAGRPTPKAPRPAAPPPAGAGRRPPPLAGRWRPRTRRGGPERPGGRGVGRAGWCRR